MRICIYTSVWDVRMRQVARGLLLTSTYCTSYAVICMTVLMQILVDMKCPTLPRFIGGTAYYIAAARCLNSLGRA